MRFFVSLLAIICLITLATTISGLSINRETRLRQRGLHPSSSLLSTSTSTTTSSITTVSAVNARWAKNGANGIKADAAAIRTCIDTHLAGLTRDFLNYRMNNPTFHAGQLKQHSAWVARAVEKFFLNPTNNVDHRWAADLHSDLLPILTLGAYLHDVGKAGDKVFDFTSDADPAKTKNHPLAGFEILTAKPDGGEYQLADGTRISILGILQMKCNLSPQEIALVQLMAGLHYSFLPIIKANQINGNFQNGIPTTLSELQSLLHAHDISYSFTHPDDLVDLVRMTMLMGAADVLGAQPVAGDSPQGITTLAENSNLPVYQTRLTKDKPYNRFDYARLNNNLRDAVITWVTNPANVDLNSPGRFVTGASTLTPCKSPLQTIIPCQVVEKGRLSGKAVGFWNKARKRGMKVEYCPDSKETSLTFYTATDCSKGAKAPLYVFPDLPPTRIKKHNASYKTGLTEPWSLPEGATIHVASQGRSRIELPLGFSDALTRNEFIKALSALIKDPHSWLKNLIYAPPSKQLTCPNPSTSNPPLRTSNEKWDWADNFISCNPTVATSSGLTVSVIPTGATFFMGDKGCNMPANAMPGVHVNPDGNPIWLGVKAISCSSYKCASSTDPNKQNLVNHVHSFTTATDLRLVRLDDIDNILKLAALFERQPVNQKHFLTDTALGQLTSAAHPNMQTIKSKVVTVPNNAAWATSPYANKMSSWALTLATGLLEDLDDPVVKNQVDRLADYQKEILNRNLVRRSQLDIDNVIVEALCTYLSTLAQTGQANDVVHGYAVPFQMLKTEDRDGNEGSYGFHPEIMLCSAVNTKNTNIKPTAYTYKLTPTGLSKC